MNAVINAFLTEVGLRDEDSGLVFWSKGSELVLRDEGSVLGFSDKSLGDNVLPLGFRDEDWNDYCWKMCTTYLSCYECRFGIKKKQVPFFMASFFM